MTDQAVTPTSDESLLAAISHFFGLLVAFIVWITQKDKSRFIHFQSIQAIAFDLIMYAVVFVVTGVLISLMFALLALGIADLAIVGTQSNPAIEPVGVLVALMTATPLFIPFIMIIISGVFFIIRLIATLQTAQGKNFHYPWLGAWVEKRLAS